MLATHLPLLDALRIADQRDRDLRAARTARRKKGTRESFIAAVRAHRAARQAGREWRRQWRVRMGGPAARRALAATRALLALEAEDLEGLISSADGIVVNSSAGKDSLYLLHKIAAIARRLGMLHKILVVHADLDNAEWPGVPELAQRQAEREGVRFVRVAAEGGLLGLVERRGMWPDALRRLCTATLKRQPCAKAITQFVRSLGIKGRPAIILNAIGIRAEESPDRAKKPALDLDTRASSGQRLVLTWHPLLATTEAEIWATIAAEGLEYHEVYDAQLSRLSCIFCVLAGAMHLVHAARIAYAMGLSATTDLFTSLEAKIGHTFKQGVTLSSIDAAARMLDALDGPLTWERGDAIRRHVSDEAAEQWLRKQAVLCA